MAFEIKPQRLVLISPPKERTQHPSWDSCEMFPELGQYGLDRYHKHLCSMVKFQEFLQRFLEILICFTCHYYYSFVQFIQMQERTRRNILVAG